MLERPDIHDSLVPGTLVARRFELVSVVGEGGMGVVWSAIDRSLRQGSETPTVALKFLRDAQRESLRHERRLLREAKAVARIEHPSVAKIHEVLETEAGTPFLVMDLLSGEPLSKHMARGALGLAELKIWLSDVISAMAAAHAAGIVHRDLKPENIFILDEPVNGSRVRVLDFGIAKALHTLDSETQDSLTQTGAMLGTPYYMAPEQVFGDNDVDERVDVWALGVVLYEALSGVRPTQANGVGQVLKIIVNKDIPPLPERSGVPNELRMQVARMLQRDRTLRPSMQEVATALSFLDPARSGRPPALKGESSGGKVKGDAPETTGVLAPAQEPTGSSTFDALASRSPKATAKPNWLAWGIGAFALLTFAGAAGFGRKTIAPVSSFAPHSSALNSDVSLANAQGSGLPVASPLLAASAPAAEVTTEPSVSSNASSAPKGAAPKLSVPQPKSAKSTGPKPEAKSAEAKSAEAKSPEPKAPLGDALVPSASNAPGATPAKPATSIFVPSTDRL
jgi:eukaryotic-like serine/threonine-protein kinase